MSYLFDTDFYSVRSENSRWTETIWRKYVRYYEKKDRFRRTGRTADTDSTRGKTYTAENLFRGAYRDAGGTIKRFKTKAQAERRMRSIVESKTWAKLRGHDSPHHSRIRLRLPRQYTGMSWARCDGMISLSSRGMNEYVLIHELAHMVGFHNHHDVAFRRDLVKLVSSFMGRDVAKLLKKSFRDAGLKFTTDVKVKNPEEWLESYLHMEKVRAAAKS